VYIVVDPESTVRINVFPFSQTVDEEQKGRNIHKYEG